MGLGNWIGGALGFILAPGPLGIIAGAVLGGVVERFLGNQQNDGTHQAYTTEEQRNSFLFSLLVLLSHVIQADGKIMHSEMTFVRHFLRNNFGVVAEKQGEEILQSLFRMRKQMVDQKGAEHYRKLIADSCHQMSIIMTEEQRLQILSLLIEVAKADGNVHPQEVAIIKELAMALLISPQTVESLLHMNTDNLEDAYTVLELSPSATDEEVKKAYRRLALKHHPDRVATLGEDVRKAAERKFQALGEAKERIYKARGLK